MNADLRTALIIGCVIVAILIFFSVFPGLFGWGYGYGMMGTRIMGGYDRAWFIPVLMVFFLGLITWGIVALMRGISRSNTDSSTQADSPLEILKKRYARGEINKQEYEEIKKDLT